MAWAGIFPRGHRRQEATLLTLRTLGCIAVRRATELGSRRQRSRQRPPLLRTLAPEIYGGPCTRKSAALNSAGETKASSTQTPSSRAIPARGSHAPSWSFALAHDTRWPKSARRPLQSNEPASMNRRSSDICRAPKPKPQWPRTDHNHRTEVRADTDGPNRFRSARLVRAPCMLEPCLRTTSSGYPKTATTRHLTSQRARGSEREALAPGRLAPALAARMHQRTGASSRMPPRPDPRERVETRLHPRYLPPLDARVSHRRSGGPSRRARLRVGTRVGERSAFVFRSTDESWTTLSVGSGRRLG